MAARTQKIDNETAMLDEVAALPSDLTEFNQATEERIAEIVKKAMS